MKIARAKMVKRSMPGVVHILEDLVEHEHEHEMYTIRTSNLANQWAIADINEITARVREDFTI